MQPNSQSVLTLLRSLMRNPESRVLEHMICVGDTAARIAEALRSKGYELNVDKVRAMGYIHDIGKLIGTISSHALVGYHYLQEQGYDQEYCNVCLTHSFPNGQPDCIIGSRLDSQQENEIATLLKGHQRTLAEKIISLCDFLCLYNVMTVDKRMIDLISRYGTWSGTQRCVLAVQELKAELDNMLGYNLYKLFPEICDNL